MEGKELVAISQDANELAAFVDNGPTGFEGVDNDCMYRPFLKIAQSATEEAKEDSPSHIKGLKPGMFYCKTFKKVYEKAVNIVILKFYRAYAVYNGTGSESKFVGNMEVGEFERNIAPRARRDKSYMVDEKGYRYVDTRNLLVLNYDHMEDGPMLLSLSSTGIGPSKKLMSLASQVRANKDGKVVPAPIWSSVWKLESKYFTNPQGSYYQIEGIERLGWVGKEYASGIKSLFEQALEVDLSAVSEADAPTAEDHAQVATESPAVLATQAAFGGKIVGTKTAPKPAEPDIF